MHLCTVFGSSCMVFTNWTKIKASTKSAAVVMTSAKRLETVAEDRVASASARGDPDEDEELEQQIASLREGMLLNQMPVLGNLRSASKRDV